MNSDINNISKNRIAGYNEAKCTLDKYIKAEAEKLSEKLAKANESEKDHKKVKAKCMQIYSKIVSGKKVTFAELEYLKENDYELYALAMFERSLQNNNKNGGSECIASGNYKRNGKEDEEFPQNYILEESFNVKN